MKELFEHNGTKYFDCLKDILIEKSCEGILKTSDNYFCKWGYPKNKIKIKKIIIKGGEEATVSIKVNGKIKSFAIKIKEV